MATVEINSFVRRQTPESPYTHFVGTDDELLTLIHEGLENNNFVSGYRDGVILVKVNPRNFFTGIVELQEGDQLIGSYSPRREGEVPRQSTRVVREGSSKQPAQLVEIVLYSHNTLDENGDAEYNSDYEVISMNGYPTLEPAPIDPFTLMHNHFGSDGGTATNMTPEQFEQSLQESFNYWKSKGMLA